MKDTGIVPRTGRSFREDSALIQERNSEDLNQRSVSETVEDSINRPLSSWPLHVFLTEECVFL